MEGMLKVTPSALRSKAGEFDSSRSAIRGMIDQMNAKIGGITSTWQGAASQSYQASYNGLKDDIERLDRMIAEHVSDLNEMADVYAKAETTTESTNQALPRDAIQ